MPTTYTLVAPCFFGTESTLAFEVRRIGAQNVQVTDDDDVNENPQLTAVTFPNENEESFLLGWYSVHDEDGVQKNDIRLAAFTSEGLLRDDFVDSLSVVSSQTAGNITSNFRFSKGAEQL